METRLGARQRRRPPTVHRGSTHAPRLQRPVATEDEASACSELRLGCHPETPVIEPCRGQLTGQVVSSLLWTAALPDSPADSLRLLLSMISSDTCSRPEPDALLPSPVTPV